jgi:hypothetical protein
LRLLSWDGFPDVLVVDHDSKFTSAVFRAFAKGMGSCLIVGLAYHKNTNAKVERANCVISKKEHVLFYIFNVLIKDIPRARQSTILSA